jgi:pyruvate ferredoxin oxidoreductase gamma subunit
MAEGIYEIRWHGRGGQGAVTAARIVAEAAYLKGYRGVTAAPSFGAERRGVPVSASTRISRQPILILSQVVEPDVVVVLDQTLLAYSETTDGLRRGGLLIVNSARRPDETGFDDKFNTVTADATSICRELGLTLAGLTLVNIAMLGALSRATGLVDKRNIIRVLKSRFSGKALEANLTAVSRTYDAIVVNGKG